MREKVKLENNMNKANKRLMSGTAIYMVGSLSSKLLQLLVLPIVTAILLTDEYGYYDLIVSTFSLVLPIITLKTIDAVFRFMFKTEEETQKKILSTVSFFLIGGVAASCLLFYVVAKFIPSLISFPGLICGYFATYVFFDYSQKTARSMGCNLQFAISGVLHTVLLLGTELLALLVFDMRVDGLLIANIVANSGVVLYLNKKIRFEKKVRIRYCDKAVFNEIIKFSLPLIPNSICWWFVSASNKYIISFFLGTGSNGIYTVSNKFPQILTFATSVFQLAWQESAIIEEDSKRRNEFYTNVFNQYLRILGSGFIVGLIAIRIVMPYMIDASYYESIKYVPLLLLSVVFSSFSQFYGTAYIVFKKTKGVMVTTLVSAIVNTALCLILIKPIGLFAPVISTCVAFFVQWIHRAHQLKDDFRVKIDLKMVAILSILGTASVVVYYTIENIVGLLVVCLISAIIACVINRSILKALLSGAKNIL